jgi:hypothetical protein
MKATTMTAATTMTIRLQLRRKLAAYPMVCTRSEVRAVV